MTTQLTLKSAANELQSLRNEILAHDADDANLAERCDAVGRWLGSQKMSDKVLKLLSEASLLRSRLDV